MNLKNHFIKEKKNLRKSGVLKEKLDLYTMLS